MIVTLQGIRIRATTGWLITYLLLVSTLLLWRGLPAVGAGSDVERSIAVLLVPLVLLPTVVAHELAHVLVARRQGSRVDEIDLRMVGMSKGIATDARGPLGEVRTAAAGPLLSLVQGVVLLAIAIPLERADAPLALAGWLVGCVAVANLVLGLASLYPGYPMDGADVVHGIAWHLTHSRQRAAQAVVRVGVVAGWAVMLTGLMVALKVDASAGLWLTLLGWSLGRISRNARDHDRLTELVAGLTVADATDREIAVVSPTLTLDTVVAQDRLSEGPGMFPVVRAGTLVGVIDLRDVGGAGRPGTQLRVADRMRAIDRVRVVTEGQRLWDAVAILERDRVSAVPVVASDDHGRLLGLVTRSTVQRLLRARSRPAAGAQDAPDTSIGGSPDGPVA
jgi:CBS domain-containing protein